MHEPFLYLASGSPRRRELLAQLGVSFELLVTDIDESLRPDEPADAYVRRMAMDKARAALGQMPARRAPVLGAAVRRGGHDGLRTPGSRSEAVSSGAPRAPGRSRPSPGYDFDSGVVVLEGPGASCLGPGPRVPLGEAAE